MPLPPCAFSFTISFYPLHSSLLFPALPALPVGMLLSASFVAIATIAGAIFPTSAAHKPAMYNASQILADQNLENPCPYEFPVLQNGSLADFGQFPMPLCHGFRLEEASIDQLQHALSHDNLTSVQLVYCYMQRIYQTDSYIQ